MVIRHLLIFFIFILPLQVSSQKYINLKTYDVDSLLSILPQQSGKELANSLNYLAISLSFVGYDSSMHYADEAMKLSSELEYDEGIAEAYRNYGHIYLYQGNYPKALDNFLEALRLFDKLDKKRKAGWVCYYIGLTHYFANNFDKTIEYGYTALDIFKEHNDDGTLVGSVRDTIMVYAGLAETYALMGMHIKSLDMCLAFVNAMKKNKYNNTELVISVFTTGASYMHIGEYDSAVAFFHRSLAYPDENRNTEALKYRSITWLGYLHNNKGEIDSALFYQQKALKFYNKHGFLYWALSASNSLGSIYLENEDLIMAEKHFRQSESLFDEMLMRNSWYRHDSLKYIASYGLELYIPLPSARLKELSWSSGLQMYTALYTINDLRNKTNEALKYHIAYASAKDTLNKLQQNREIIELQTRHETERKEKQIDFLSQENALQELRLTQSRYMLLGLGGLVILVIILAIFIIRQNKLRAQQQTLQLQQKLFRSQMNPHFIFNSLTSIQKYIMVEEAHQASKYLSRFAKLIRNILDSSIEDFVPLEQEISTIENYLELQKVRFKDKFEYTLEVDEAINPENINIPPMLTQPFIENAIEHGIKMKRTKGHIWVRVRREDKLIIIEVEDNGIGRKKAMEILHHKNKDHKSIATAITHERIRVINKKLKKKITLLIQDLKNDSNEPSGTLVRIEVPVQ